MSDDGPHRDLPAAVSPDPVREPPVCRRCEARLEPADTHEGYCSKAHRLESSRQRRALIEAGPGCARCYRGAVFFDWRPEGGRQRSASIREDSARAAPCWCPAGRRIRLEGGYKTWGYMRDYAPDGEREIAPRSAPLERCRIASDADEEG